MSATVIVPPPNTAQTVGTVPRLLERARALLTALNLHFAGVAVLAVLMLWLAIHVFFVWSSLNSLNADAMSDQHAKLKAAEIAAQPMRGLDAKVTKSTRQADAFSASRFPYATSQVAAELGHLAQGSSVRLSRVQYAYVPALSGKDTLTEVRMDASVSGDYRPVVQFINALERDKMFFLVSGINLTGQQTGQVNLRLRLSAFLRVPNTDEAKKQLANAASDASAKPAGGVQ